MNQVENESKQLKNNKWKARALYTYNSENSISKLRPYKNDSIINDDEDNHTQ